MDWVYGLDLNLNIHPQGLWIGSMDWVYIHKGMVPNIWSTSNLAITNKRKINSAYKFFNLIISKNTSSNIERT